jgi:MFS family permease
MFLNIATFVPSYLVSDDRGIKRGITTTEFAFVLAMYNTARLLLSTTIGKKMNKVGRKNFIIIGFILMIVSTVGFGSLDFIDPTPQEK